MIDFIERMPIDDVIESNYNPRIITPEALNYLELSLKKFGMVKPLIINAFNNVIIAGHQRKKAAMSIGLTHLPCIRISTPKIQDEIHFNLLHNSIETNHNIAYLEEFKIGAYSYCPSTKIKIKGEPQNVFICSEITRLISQFGEWGSVVTDSRGNIILNTEYAYCAKKLGFGVLSFSISDEGVAKFMKFINIEYGKYNYDNLGIKTYHQFMAQLKRRSTDGRRLNKSTLYEKYLIPNLRKDDSIIDIGAGRMSYFKLVKSQGYNIHAYEPSLRIKGSNNLDIKEIIANILRAENEVKTNGLFDWCVLEYVINSIVNDDFEKAVLILCNATLKSTGTLLTCTRNIEGIIRPFNQKSITAHKGRQLFCLDDKNYTLSIAQGIAFKQKFHTKDSYITLLKKYFDKVELLFLDDRSIYCTCTVPKQLPREVYEEYLEKELNIEYPNGFKHNKHKGLMNALISKVVDRYG